jgi:hypothetical protein
MVLDHVDENRASTSEHLAIARRTMRSKIIDLGGQFDDSQ